MKKVVILTAALALVLTVAFGGYTAFAAPYVKGDAPQIDKESTAGACTKDVKEGASCPAKSKDAGCCKAKAKDAGCCKAKGEAKAQKAPAGQ